MRELKTEEYQGAWREGEKETREKSRREEKTGNHEEKGNEREKTKLTERRSRERQTDGQTGKQTADGDERLPRDKVKKKNGKRKEIERKRLRKWVKKRQDGKLFMEGKRKIINCWIKVSKLKKKTEEKLR